jgi:hypothetical protein
MVRRDRFGASPQWPNGPEQILLFAASALEIGRDNGYDVSAFIPKTCEEKS